MERDIERIVRRQSLQRVIEQRAESTLPDTQLTPLELAERQRREELIDRFGNDDE